MKDRLNDLQATFVKKSSIDDDQETDRLIPEDWKEVDDFLAHVTKVNKCLERLEALLISLKKHQNTILSDPVVDQKCFQQFDEMNATFCDECKMVNKDVNALDRDAEKAVAPSAESRIKKSQMITLKKRLSQVVTKYHSDQMEYQEKLKKITLHTLEIKGFKDVTEDVVMAAIESGDLSGLTKGLVLGEAGKKALYEEVKTRRDELRKLEDSVRELHDLFHDLCLLVQSQGDMIDNIEANVEAAGEYANKAKANVIGARELRRKANKMKIFMCCGLTILVIILFIVLQGLVCHFTPIC
ncbi:unnamed protein product [Auanema sp. JU1783]|nr:unnamed protein product [Auanema sp. JU1783]